MNNKLNEYLEKLSLAKVRAERVQAESVCSVGEDRIAQLTSDGKLVITNRFGAMFAIEKEDWLRLHNMLSNITGA